MEKQTALPHKIMHIELDAFYAFVEQQDNPSVQRQTNRHSVMKMAWAFEKVLYFLPLINNGIRAKLKFFKSPYSLQLCSVGSNVTFCN